MFSVFFFQLFFSFYFCFNFLSRHISWSFIVSFSILYISSSWLVQTHIRYIKFMFKNQMKKNVWGKSIFTKRLSSLFLFLFCFYPFDCIETHITIILNANQTCTNTFQKLWTYIQFKSNRHVSSLNVCSTSC